MGDKKDKSKNQSASSTQEVSLNPLKWGKKKDPNAPPKEGGAWELTKRFGRKTKEIAVDSVIKPGAAIIVQAPGQLVDGTVTVYQAGKHLFKGDWKAAGKRARSLKNQVSFAKDVSLYMSGATSIQESAGIVVSDVGAMAGLNANQQKMARECASDPKGFFALNLLSKARAVGSANGMELTEDEVTVLSFLVEAKSGTSSDVAKFELTPQSEDIKDSGTANPRKTDTTGLLRTALGLSDTSNKNPKIVDPTSILKDRATIFKNPIENISKSGQERLKNVLEGDGTESEAKPGQTDYGKPDAYKPAEGNRQISKRVEILEAKVDVVKVFTMTEFQAKFFEALGEPNHGLTISQQTKNVLWAHLYATLKKRHAKSPVTLTGPLAQDYADVFDKVTISAAANRDAANKGTKVWVNPDIAAVLEAWAHLESADQSLLEIKLEGNYHRARYNQLVPAEQRKPLYQSTTLEAQADPLDPTDFSIEASSTTGNANYASTPDVLIDGSMTSCSGDGLQQAIGKFWKTAASDNHGHWVCVDLNESYNIAKIEVVNGSGYSPAGMKDVKLFYGTAVTTLSQDPETAENGWNLLSSATFAEATVTGVFPNYCVTNKESLTADLPKTMRYFAIKNTSNITGWNSNQRAQLSAIRFFAEEEEEILDIATYECEAPEDTETEFVYGSRQIDEEDQIIAVNVFPGAVADISGSVPGEENCGDNCFDSSDYDGIVPGSEEDDSAKCQYILPQTMDVASSLASASSSHIAEDTTEEIFWPMIPLMLEVRERGNKTILASVLFSEELPISPNRDNWGCSLNRTNSIEPDHTTKPAIVKDSLEVVWRKNCNKIDITFEAENGDVPRGIVAWGPEFEMPDAVNESKLRAKLRFATEEEVAARVADYGE
jgi:hypothetical protein